jgi:PIN domain nuclease of toxin-antitoxin system
MRYYLDTNILVFILFDEQQSIHYSVRVILEDYSHTLFTSSVAVQELVLLFRIGKLSAKSPYKTEQSVIKALENLGIQINYFNSAHFLEYTRLQIAENHKDMNDHLIISQAISDKITLISSDSKFPFYEKQKLKLLYNRR